MDESDWSVPEATVMDAARDLIDGERAAVLATIVHVEGSAYRRPGAKMVVASDGEGVGSITAGCLEDEVVELAREVAETGNARVETYDLTNDDDVWGLGVGCNGVLDVLLEPLDESYRPAIKAYRSGEGMAVCTVLEGSADLAVGDRAFYDANGNDEGAFSAPWPDTLCETLSGPAARAASEGTSNALTVDGSGNDRAVRVFVDGVPTPPKLVVFGMGHDIGPLVDLATKSDFRVTVLGFRGATSTTDRFPGAHDVRSTSPANLHDAYDFDENTYTVVMSHNFVDDRLALEALLDTSVPYIGLLGPQKRFAEMREEFTAEGRTFSPTEHERIYTPIGLDLGGETPYQIAHSIVAELLAVHNDREPDHLSSREGPIHDRAPLTGVETTD